MTLILTPQLVQKIKDRATALYKARHYSVYEPELQTVVCTLLALAEVVPAYEIEAEERVAHEPVDDLG